MSSLKKSQLVKKTLPRERIALHGAEVLSDAELLAIFLRTGRVGRHVLEVAEDLIKEWGSLRRLAGCSITELSQISGIGSAKASELKAAFEMGVRMARPEAKRPRLERGEAIYKYMKDELQSLPYESFWVLLLDARYGLLAKKEIFRGSLNQSIAHPREIFAPAVAQRSYAIAVVHNHPSGDPLPSPVDCELTKRLVQAGDLLQIFLIDHVIIGAVSEGQRPYFSFYEAGFIER